MKARTARRRSPDQLKSARSHNSRRVAITVTPRGLTTVDHEILSHYSGGAEIYLALGKGFFAVNIKETGGTMCMPK